MGISSSPRDELRTIMGRHTSIELIPATDMGANRPPQRASVGVPRRAIISRMTLASRAMVASSVAPCTPRVALLRSAISTDEGVVAESATYEQAVAQIAPVQE